MKYKIHGEPLPVVTCTVNSGETLITERGSMCWMSPNIRMETITNGGMGKALGRMLSGEAMFQNRYTSIGGEGSISFASSFPGSIRALDLSAGKGMIVQKSAFLACEANVNLSLHFQRKFSTGLFGGEGFIMQKLSGKGIAFIEIDGSAVDYELEVGQSIVVDTGYLAAMSESCKIEIQKVPGVKNVLFGGEGLFHTVITGPGKIILQTMPISNVAATLRPFFPTN